MVTSMTAPNILQSLLDAIDAPVLVLEAGQIVAANDAFLQETGYILDDLLTKKISDLVVPDQRARIDRLSPENIPAAPISMTLLLRNDLACDVTCSVRGLPGSSTNILLTLMPATMTGMVSEAYANPETSNGVLADHPSVVRGITTTLEEQRSLSEMLDGLLRYLARYVVYTSANVCLLEEGRYVLATLHGDMLKVNSVSQFMASDIVTERVVNDKSPLFIQNLDSLDHQGSGMDLNYVSSWVAVPIINHNMVIGIVNLVHRERNRFSTSDMELTAAIVNQVTQTLANAWLYERAKYELQEREKAQDVLLDTLIKTDALYQIARLLMQTENLDSVLNEVLHILDLSLETETVFLLTFETVNGEIKRRYLHGVGNPDRLEREYAGLLAQTIASVDDQEPKEAQYTVQYTSDSQQLPDGRKAIAGAIKQYGVLVAVRPADAPDFSAEDYDLFDASTSQLAISLENANLYAQMRQSNIRLEHLVDKHVRDLRLERQKLRAILDATGEGIFYIEDFRFEYVNPALCRMVGYLATELIGQKLDFIHIPIEDNRPNATGDVFTNLLSGTMNFSDHNDVARLRRKDGSEFYANITFTLVGGPGAERMRMVGVVRDVSRQLALQEQRMRFITNAAHELRTPLTSFALRLHMIRKQPERMHHHLDSLERVSGYMKDLVEDMLALTRYEKGSMELVRGTLDLRDIIRSTVDSVMLFAQERGITLHVDMPDRPVKGQFDAERMGKMVEKLMTNAISFSQRQTEVRLILDVVEMTGLKHARITLEDTGDPMDSHTLETIFEPFSRPGLGDQVDTGMGLALAYAIARLHGGIMVASSLPNQPNRIVTTLPLNPQN